MSNLRKRIGNQAPTENEFKVHLSEVTGDDDQARKDSEKIRSLYIDAMTYFTEIQEEKDSGKKARDAVLNHDDTFKDTSGGTVILYEDIRISFPKDDLKKAKTAKKLIEMKIAELEDKDDELDSLVD